MNSLISYTGNKDKGIKIRTLQQGLGKTEHVFVIHLIETVNCHFQCQGNHYIQNRICRGGGVKERP